MADIAAERAWMGQRARQQAVETARDRLRRDRADHERHRQTCWYCFHLAHVIEYAMSGWSGLPGDPWEQHGPTSVTVLACADPVCPCGVPPCPGCGDRVRPSYRDPGTLACPMCGHETQEGAVAYA